MGAPSRAEVALRLRAVARSTASTASVPPDVESTAPVLAEAVSLLAADQKPGRICLPGSGRIASPDLDEGCVADAPWAA